MKMWRIIEGEALILDPETGNYYSVNPVGTQILQGLLAGSSIDEIASSVRVRCAPCPENLAATVQEFAEALRQESLDQLDPSHTEDENDESFEYVSPALRKYDQLHQVAAYSPDEI